MSPYVDFFLDSDSSVAELETVEITHSDFSQTFRFVRNQVGGITATLEDLSVVTFDYYPARVSLVGVQGTLDQGIQLDLGDLGEVVPQELDLLRTADSFDEAPILKYRSFRSDDLTSPLNGPWELEVKSCTASEKGCSIVAVAKSLNVNRTGELYKISRFTMLRGLVQG